MQQISYLDGATLRSFIIDPIKRIVRSADIQMTDEESDSTCIFYFPEKYCLIPTTSGTKKEALELSTYDFAITAKDDRDLIEIEHLNSYLVFSRTETKVARSAEHVGLAALLNTYQKHVGTSDRIYLHHRSACIDVTVYIGGDLQMINNYVVQDPEGTLYFVLLAYFNASLNPAEIPLFVHGDERMISKSTMLLKRYVRTVEQAVPSEDWQSALDTDDGYDAYALLACADSILER